MKALCLFVVLWLAACSGEPVKPEIDARVESLTEIDNGFAKAGQVTLRLENVSPYPVYSVTVSVSLSTDVRTYHRTIYDDRGIPPFTVIWLSLEFTYVDISESASLEGVSIDDFFCN